MVAEGGAVTRPEPWNGHAALPRRGAPGRAGAAKWSVACAACTAAALSAWFGPPAARAPDPTVPRPAVERDLSSFDRAPIVARLERASRRGGGEFLRGETKFAWSGSRRLALVTEEAELDRDGRLVRVEVRVASRALGEPTSVDEYVPERVSLDAAAGTVVVVAEGGRTKTMNIATDLPWAYVPVNTPTGAPASTPVAAIVARRAAETSGAVRLFDARGRDAAVMSDQLSVSDAHEAWVVLGDDLATFTVNEAGQSVLVRLRVAGLGVEMTSIVKPPRSSPLRARWADGAALPP
jgi:hypothetical protein